MTALLRLAAHERRKYGFISTCTRTRLKESGYTATEIERFIALTEKPE